MGHGPDLGANLCIPLGMDKSLLGVTLNPFNFSPAYQFAAPVGFQAFKEDTDQ